MLTGQNGILNNSAEAKEKTEQAKQEEANKMTMMEAMIQTAGVPVANPSSYGENPNAQATADGAGKYFALPTKAKYIEGTVDTGVVVNIKGSEFVWVPVENVVLDESRVNELPTSSENGTVSGKKTYTPMAVKVGNDYKGLLYEFSESNGYLRYGSNAGTNYQGSSTKNYREPDVLSSYDGGNDDNVEGKITKERLTREYNAMIESVLKYKGFYVARYEAGLDKTTKEIVFKNASVEANNTTTTNAGNSETKSWYGLYKKIKTFTNDSDKVASSMIWGSQYDAMMNWMAKNGKIVGTANSDVYNSKTITGNKSTDIINNVYDLYGCHLEWTLEASDARAHRGGSYLESCSPAHRDGRFPNDTHGYFSSRATLIIN